MLSKLRLRLSAIVIAAFCALLPSAAFALTVQEIILMSQQGVSEDVLVNIIKNADLPELTEGDYQTLREAGITQKVQDALVERASSASEPASQPDAGSAPETPAEPVTCQNLQRHKPQSRR